MHQHIFNAWFQGDWGAWAATTCSLHSQFNYSSFSKGSRTNDTKLENDQKKPRENRKMLFSFTRKTFSNKANHTDRIPGTQYLHHHLGLLVEFEFPTILWSWLQFLNHPAIPTIISRRSINIVWQSFQGLAGKINNSQEETGQLFSLHLWI